MHSEKRLLVIHSALLSLLAIVSIVKGQPPASTTATVPEQMAAFRAFEGWWYRCEPYPDESQARLIETLSMNDTNGAATYWFACSVLRAELKPKTQSKGGKIMDRAAQLGSKPAAAVMAAARLESDQTTLTERDEAKKMLLDLMEQRQPDALYRLGKLYRDGCSAIEVDLDKSEKLLRVATSQGFVRANKELALTLLKLVRADDAFAVLKRGAEANDTEAQLLLAEWYDRGLATAPSAAEALKWYRRAAERGHPKAQFAIVQFLMKEKDEKNNSEIVRLLKASAGAIPGAKLILVDVWLSGAMGEDVDFAAAERALRELSSQGVPEAKYELGRALIEGIWLSKNDAAGRDLLAEASKAGHVKAEVFLRMYLHALQHPESVRRM